MKRLILSALLLVPSAILIAESPSDAAWQVLGGSEKEKGEAVQIVEAKGENIAHTNTSRGYQTYRVSALQAQAR